MRLFVKIAPRILGIQALILMRSLIGSAFSFPTEDICVSAAESDKKEPVSRKERGEIS